MLKLGDVLIYEQPTKYIVKSENYNDSFPIPVLTPGQTFILGYTDETDGIYLKPLPVIIFDDFTTATKLVNFPFKVKSSAMKILKPANNEVFLPYWYYFLSSLKVDNELHKRYWISVFANKQVSCPSFLEQKRIAGILDKVQSLIALQKQQLEKLDLLIKSKFIDMFGDPITNPKNWPIRRMGDVFKITSGGTPSTQEDSYWSGGTISWIGSNLCQNVILNKNDGQFITENGLNNSSAKILPVGTVLIALVGATIGKTALLNFSTTTNQNVAAVWVSKNKSYDSLFMFYFIQGLYDLFMRIGSGKFKMANLQFINNLPIFNVSVSLQTQFANFVKSVEQQKEVFTTRLSHLETLYKSLMQEYFG